ncbi:MAG: hypothetical protein ABEJ98_01875 [Candidatus Nanohaloarchaea archaeon]
MSVSSDEQIKNEIVERFGTQKGSLRLRVFPEGSDEDQTLFSKGGLTFGDQDCAYGSCDAAWYKEGESWYDPYSGQETDVKPVIALEGTDALNRGSSGNAQLQRFHHALGAVKNGIIGIYYLRKGNHPIYNALFGMAYHASQVEEGTYIVTDDLDDIEEIIDAINSENEVVQDVLDRILNRMKNKFDKQFNEKYDDWENFAKRRSTIIKEDAVIKYAGRNKRNFTDSSQRAGHIAVGEMYLTKYFFPDKEIYYLWPRMTREDLRYLDKNKGDDKEWKLLRTEENVTIATIDDLVGIDEELEEKMMDVKSKPLKGDALSKYTSAKNKLDKLLREGEISIEISEERPSFREQKSLNEV